MLVGSGGFLFTPRPQVAVRGICCNFVFFPPESENIVFGQLDQPLIVIRKRTLLEIAELSLRVLRKYGFSMLLPFFFLAFPFTVLNYFLLETLGPWDALDAEEYTQNLWVYSLLNLALQLFELPFVASLCTAYLGRLVFSIDEKPRMGSVVFMWFNSFGQLLYYLILLRPLIGLFHPFLSEVILLERTPFRSRSKAFLSTWGRSKVLHPDQFGRSLIFWTACVFFGFLVLFGLCTIVQNAILYLFVVEEDADTFWITKTVFPFLFWSVLFFMSVVQFFRYLDLRIEREGWDVELAFRAERARMDSGIL